MAGLVPVQIKVAWKNPKALRALKSLARNLESVAEDFEYREDVKEAIRAARYLAKAVTVVVDK